LTILDIFTQLNSILKNVYYDGQKALYKHHTRVGRTKFAQ